MGDSGQNQLPVSDQHSRVLTSYTRLGKTVRELLCALSPDGETLEVCLDGKFDFRLAHVDRHGGDIDYLCFRRRRAGQSHGY